MRMPSWLKIVIILMLTSLVFSVLNAAAGSFILLLVLIALIVFPGKDPANPRLVRWMPALWGLNFLAALAFLVAGALGKSLVSAETELPSPGELWGTIFFVPPLIWTLVKRHRLFKPLLIASTVFMLGLELYKFTESLRDAKAVIELIGEGSAELILTIYLLRRVRTSDATSSIAHE